jgi:hypothetical protein
VIPATRNKIKRRLNLNCAPSVRIIFVDWLNQGIGSKILHKAPC